MPSRWSRAELDGVCAQLAGHWEDWALDRFGERADEQGQPSIEATLVRVTATIADWADSLPAGLLTLVPSLTPVR